MSCGIEMNVEQKNIDVEKVMICVERMLAKVCHRWVVKKGGVAGFIDKK